MAAPCREEIPARNVRISGGFWGERLETNARRAIFHQWDQLEASGCIDNFRIAAGEREGLREGWFFADSDAAKWLDAAARISVHHPDARLTALMDGLIALLARAQAPDGYLFTYNQIHFPGTRWANLQIEHELYCHGHLIEAGISHYEATGRTEMLDVARAAADRIVADFRGRGPACTPGHEEIEIALLRLHRVTGHAPYLELAQQFIEQRGRTRFFAPAILLQDRDVAERKKIVAGRRQAYLAAHPDTNPHKVPPGNAAPQPANAALRWAASALTGKYFQQHAPVRRQTVPVGHAVRFGYLQTAVAMLYCLQGDATLLPALAATWERMAARRMYVTGGTGSLPSLEGFGRDYELDPEIAYAETCAALASLAWNWQMALITGEARYSDLLEWQLYNAAATGMGLDGESYLYNNPLACRGAVTRQPRCGGMAAITRGPLVYCLESTDNTHVDLFDVEVDASTLRPVPAPDLLGGVTLLQAEGRWGAGGAQTRPLRGGHSQGAPAQGVPAQGTLTFIPYMLWANRGPSQMNVFVRERT